MRKLGQLAYLAAFVVSLTLGASVPVMAQSQPFQLQPFKDELFSYHDILSATEGSKYRTIAYQEMRDINGRDEVPEKRVKRQYVDLSVKRSESDEVLQTPFGPIKHRLAGQAENASIIVVYLHGQGGSRAQGMNDYTFGGNFNRIKNLMSHNHGLYLTIDFSDFGPDGSEQIASVIKHYGDLSPGARIIIACGSMGGTHCWRLAKDGTILPRLAGLMLLGSHWDEGFTKSAAFKRKLPIFFAHGSRDPVFPVAKQEAFFQSLTKTKAYPARFVRFETGNHGTPIRMCDWREAINWMLSQ